MNILNHKFKPIQCNSNVRKVPGILIILLALYSFLGSVGKTMVCLYPILFLPKGTVSNQSLWKLAYFSVILIKKQKHCSSLFNLICFVKRDKKKPKFEFSTKTKQNGYQIEGKDKPALNINISYPLTILTCLLVNLKDIWKCVPLFYFGD